MDTIYLSAAFVSIIIIILYLSDKKIKTHNLEKLFGASFNPFLIIILLGLLSRLFAASFGFIFENDINCFKAWANHLYTYGFGSFYTSELLSFKDYPPGYMYILWLLGFIKSRFMMEDASFTKLILLPAIIFDILTACMIYKVAEKKINKPYSFILSLLYVLNPAVIINSSVWGQVDSVYTFFISLSLIYLADKKYEFSFPIFAAAVLIKPQALIFSPVYIYFAIECLKNKKEAVRLLKNIGFAITVFILGILPFTKQLNFKPIIKQYIETLSSYPYATVNAYNFYAFLGKNWVPISDTLFDVPLSLWGTAFIIIITISAFCMLIKNHNAFGIFLTAAFLNVSTFLFSVKMHERYIYPAPLLFLFSYIYIPKIHIDKNNNSVFTDVKPSDCINILKSKNILFLSAGFSITLFLNCADILNLSRNSWDYSQIEVSTFIISYINLYLYIFLLYIISCTFPGEIKFKSLLLHTRKKSALYNFNKFNVTHGSRFTKYDKIFLITLTAVYILLAFWRLGNIKFPQTIWFPESSDAAVAEISGDIDIAKISYLPGPKESGVTIIYYSADGFYWEILGYLDQNHVLAWKELDVNNSFKVTPKYIKFEPEADALIMEAAFLDSNSNIIPVRLISRTGYELFDEQHLVPKKPSFMNGTYFDEIYYPRTAYEFLNQIPPYECTHPPLGKAIIALSIKIFGLSPFGWRFAGTLFGVLMLPLIYLFARHMFKNSFWAFFACFIFTFDFMHFVQTRLATIDTYVVFFIILMYYFMYKYLTMNFYDTHVKKTLIPLALSGISAGLAISCKWQGAYAIIGLAVIFFYSIIKRYLEYKNAEKNENFSLKIIFYKNTLITILWCFVFFIIIPAAIYFLSYIPYLYAKDTTDLKKIIDNQVYMFTYHSYLNAEHSYSSSWWQWPFMLKPIFYYREELGSVSILKFLNGGFTANITSGISSFGNPAVWWTGIAALFYCVIALKKTESRDAAFFIIIGYTSQYLPWALVPRLTFIYHYFPCVPFLVLAITLFFKNYAAIKKPKNAYTYLIIVLLLFIAFYPVLSGLPVLEPLAKLLKWLPKWQLI